MIQTPIQKLEFPNDRNVRLGPLNRVMSEMSPKYRIRIHRAPGAGVSKEYANYGTAIQR